MALIEKLTGRENYPTWRFAVQTYLEHEELWSCVTAKDNETIDPKLDTKAKSKIILLVHPINYVHIQEAKTAKEVWNNLAKAFDDTGLTRRVGLLRDLINTTLENCLNIEDYVNKIMTAAHKLRNIGFKVDDEWLGTLLLAGLPDIYQPMIMALESSGLTITADSVKTKLLQDVRNSESSALYVRSKGNQFVKQTQDKTKTGKGPRCYVCNKYGHISKNCRNKKKEQKSNENTDSGYVAVLSATMNNDNNWYIDSGASMHMTMNRDWLYDEITPPISTIKVANDKKLVVKACGKVNLNVVNMQGQLETIKVQNVLYVPELATNLLSVSQIINSGCQVQFDKQGCKILNKTNKQVAAAKMINNMYRLVTHSVPAYTSASTENDSYLWHQRMAHLNFEDLNKLSESAGVTLENTDKVICISCLEGKQTRFPFPSEGSRAQAKLELIHSDVCGPMETLSMGGARYFLTFIDDFTRKVFVYVLKRRSEVFQKFQEFKVLVENQLDLTIKTLRTDNGAEYLSNEFQGFLKKSGIIHQTSTPYSPQQNGLAERMNRTLLERARCMLLNAKLQKHYWAEAVSTAAYITNRCPTRALAFLTPEEMWSGKKPDITHMKIFGCEVMVHVPKEKAKKWDSKTNKLIFIGYGEQTKGYRLLDPKTRKIIISRDVIFLESSVKRNYAVVPLSASVPNTCEDTSVTESGTTLQNVSESIEGIKDESSDDFYSDEGSLYEPEINIDHQEVMSNVTTRSKARLCQMQGNTYMCRKEIVGQENIPETYDEAISIENANAAKWKQSIEEELQAHAKNKTWQLIMKPEGVRVIGCKWVFRIKDDPSGPCFKSRLCAKGCSQKQGIDYKEIYSPTVRYDSVRVLLSEAAQHNLNIIQFDVKTAFLYGDVKEDIYMLPPEGLDTNANMVCKLNRSLYGLKQAPRCWNQKFDASLKKFGFNNSHADRCLYIGKVNQNKVYLLLYVDDGLILSKSKDSLNTVMQELKQNFEIKQCDSNNFVGLQIEKSEKYVFIHQSKYIERLLYKYNMQDANCNNIPVSPHTILEKSTEYVDKNIPYREAVGSLMHLAVVSRPDIMYGVSLVSRYLNCFDHTHWNVVKKIMKYLKETKDYGICYTSSQQNKIEAYSDADFAKDSATRKSLTGYVFIKNGAAITWATQRQQSVALSTTEAEFMAACSATKEALWLKRMLLDIGEFNQDSICLNMDNQSAICLIKNVDYHKRCKHIDVKYNFIKEKYNEKHIDLNYVCTKEQYADIFTKALPRDKFQYLRSKLGIKKLK